MNTKITTITPARAAALLDKTSQLIQRGKMRQRTMSASTVDQYARAMRSGKWVLHHQGIAISEDGGVLDGQQRLAAIVKNNAPVEIMVTTDVPLVAMQNGYKVMTIDAVDRGRARGLGVQLLVSHGISNGNNIAAVCRALSVACSKNCALKMSVTDCLAVMDIYKREIETVTSIDLAWRNNASITAALVMAIYAGTSGLDFANQYLLGDHKHTDQANILKKWLCKTHFKQGGSSAILVMSGAAWCIKAKFENRRIERGFASDAALQWLVDLQGSRAAKIRSLFSQVNQAAGATNP